MHNWLPLIWQQFLCNKQYSGIWDAKSRKIALIILTIVIIFLLIFCPLLHMTTKTHNLLISNESLIVIMMIDRIWLKNLLLGIKYGSDPGGWGGVGTFGSDMGKKVWYFWKNGKIIRKWPPPLPPRIFVPLYFWCLPYFVNRPPSVGQFAFLFRYKHLLQLQYDLKYTARRDFEYSVNNSKYSSS